jgi:capsular polysaccharide biosynthesis protein
MDQMLDQPPLSVRAAAPPTQSASPGLTRTLSLIRRWRAMLVAAALTGGLVGFGVASSGNPTYETRAVLLVGSINTDLDTLRASGQLAQTYAQLATSRPALDATGQRLGLRNLGSTISATASEVTRLLTIKVTDHDARRGARIANAHAEELIALATRQGSTSSGPGKLQVVDPAEASSSPSGPGAVPIAFVCALAGFLGALGLALLFDRSGDALRGADDVSALTGAGCVGFLGRRAWRAAPGAPVVTRADGSAAADEYRLLAAKLRAVGERSLAVLRLDDADAGIASQTAAAIAERGARVALLDVEREHATLLAPGEPAAEAPAPELSEVVSADDARHLLDRALGEYDVVLVDVPSIQRSSSGLIWARAVDGTLLTAQVDRTQRRSLSAAAESLRLVHGRLLGTILGAPPGLLSLRRRPAKRKAPKPAKRRRASRA